MINLLFIGKLYLAILTVTIIHELGHFGKVKITRWFPLPVMQSNGARTRFGGLIFNAITAIAVMMSNTQIEFLQLVGGISLIYLVLYLIIGGILPEPSEKSWTSGKLPRSFAFDDVPNKYAFQAITIALALLIFMYQYYSAIFTKIIGG